MDRGPLSPCPNRDLDNYCPVTQKTGKSSIMRQDLYDNLVCTYDTHTASVIAEPPPPPVATTPVPTPVPGYNSCTASIIAEPPPPHVAPTSVPPPVPSRLACVPAQPWPPPVFLVLWSAIKPGVYCHLSEGFKGGREISSTYTLSLFQICHFDTMEI